MLNRVKVILSIYADAAITVFFSMGESQSISVAAP